MMLMVGEQSETGGTDADWKSNAVRISAKGKGYDLRVKLGLEEDYSIWYLGMSWNENHNLITFINLENLPKLDQKTTKTSHSGSTGKVNLTAIIPC